jgi:hypothetical protein
MDLLTTVEHELAHILGFEDGGTGLMSETLAAGTRLATPGGGTGLISEILVARTRPATSTDLGSPTGLAQIFADGTFVRYDEFAVLRGLDIDLLSLRETPRIPAWVIPSLNGGGTNTETKPGSRGPDHAVMPKPANPVAATGEDGGAPTEAGLGTGLISWDKPFLGLGLRPRL